MGRSIEMGSPWLFQAPQRDASAQPPEFIDLMQKSQSKREAGVGSVHGAAGGS